MRTSAWPNVNEECVWCCRYQPDGVCVCGGKVWLVYVVVVHSLWWRCTVHLGLLTVTNEKVAVWYPPANNERK
jgi:hypothetical protein